MSNHTDTIAELSRLGRALSRTIKLATRQRNNFIAFLKNDMGYHADLPKAERDRIAAAVKERIKNVSDRIKAGTEDEGLDTAPDPLYRMILGQLMCGKLTEQEERKIRKPMEELLQTLPIYGWLQLPEQKGLGVSNLARIIGEIGNIDDYPTLPKLMKRMGCCPLEHNGKILSPATWKSMSKTRDRLPNAKWEQFGYAPRRSSVMFVTADCLVKGNKIDGNPGPYRQAYDKAKANAMAVHSDWSKARVHLHAMKLCARMVLKKLRQAWRGGYGIRSVCEVDKNVVERVVSDAA